MYVDISVISSHALLVIVRYTTRTHITYDNFLLLTARLHHDRVSKLSGCLFLAHYYSKTTIRIHTNAFTNKSNAQQQGADLIRTRTSSIP